MKKNVNWDSFKRQQVNIEKGVSNNKVCQLLNLHYQTLHRKLVITNEDEEIFNDTFIKITYKYNEDEDFVEQYIYYFNLLKGAYKRDNKVYNYLKKETLWKN